MKRQLLLSLLAMFVAVEASAQTPEEKTMSADSITTGNMRLDSIYRTIPEVLVKGQRPVVTLSGNALNYDMPRLLENRSVENAYEALKQIPGVMEMNGQLQMGAREVMVMMNGQLSSMTKEDFYALLRSIPSKRLKKVEVMYNAPARFQVRGALINIVLKRNEEGEGLQGELYESLSCKYRPGSESRLSLNYAKGKFNTNFSYNFHHSNFHMRDEKNAVHTLKNGQKIPIEMLGVTDTYNNMHRINSESSYQWAENHRLTFSYFGALKRQNSDMLNTGWQSGKKRLSASTYMHNLQLAYELPIGLKLAADYTFYKTPTEQTIVSKMEDQPFDFFSRSEQKIHRWNVSAAEEQSVGNGWNINYGVRCQGSRDNSFQYYYDPLTHQLRKDLDNRSSRNNEKLVNLYFGFSKAVNKKLSLEFSLAGEYFKSYNWHNWDWYPTLDLTFQPSPAHIFQLSVSSDKSYPDYWAMQDMVSYDGGRYSENHGNPHLKPSPEYMVQLNYILKRRYVFTGFYGYTNRYIQQTLYQSSERLAEIYKYINFDYQEQFGLQCSLPLIQTPRFQTVWTLVGLWQHEKNQHFYDIAFDRSRFYIVANMNTAWVLSTRPKIILNISGMAHSKAIQATYDLPGTASLNSSLQYKFGKDKFSLKLYCNDIFASSQINPYIRYANQNVDNKYSCYREVGLSFSYRFGGYKEKSFREVDTQRMAH